VSKIARFCLVCCLLSALCFCQSLSSSAPENKSGVSSPESGAVPAKSADHNAESNLRAGSLVPGSPSLLAIALQCYRKGDFAGAISTYERILTERPSPDAYAGLVHSYLKEKDVQQAAEAAEKGIAKSDSPRVRTARAEVWFRQGRITDAEREWVAILNSGYPEARAYLGLAQVRRSIAMYKSAKTMIDKAHELDSQDPDIREEWVGTLPRGERIKYLEEMLAGDNTWGPGEREDTQNYLEYLKSREKDKSKPCQLVSNVKGTETPLVRLLIDPSHLRGYGLPVVLNGRKSSLMLDTGASGITIKRSIAEKAGISKVSATKIWGVGDHGKRNAFTGVAESIRIGELEFKNCPVEVMESRSVAGEDGLIGADVFENFLVELNFPDEKLKLSQLPQRPGEAEQKLSLKGEEDSPDGEDTAEADAADSGKGASGKTAAISKSGPQDRYIAPEMQSYTRVFRFDHDLLVPTSIGQTSPKLFLVDSGALTNFISPGAAREVTKIHGESDVTVEGISGKVDKVFSANKATLVFGHLKQENQEMTAFDTKPLSDAEGTEISGFLGFTTLRFLDIKIDYRDALVDFEYDRARWSR
jgi:tetratricopeptide (TPR) repeat protein